MYSKKGEPKKDKRFEIRLSSKAYDELELCSKLMNISKTDVIMKGLDLVATEINKKK